MSQDIVYILGIVIAILLILIFLRSLLLRRQRLAAAQHVLTLAPTPNSTTGREWVFRGDPGMDVVRPEPAVTNLRTFPRTRMQQEAQDQDQLPLYEAPPPDYNTIPKDLERGGGGGGGGGGGIAQGQSQGEPSRIASARADSAPPGYGAVGNSGAPVVIHGPAPVATPDNNVGLFRVDVRRAWGGFGRYRG